MKKKTFVILALLLMCIAAFAKADVWEAEKNALLYDFEAMYGPMYKWDLSVRAEYAMFDFGGGFNVLPEEGDLAQERALEAAQAAIQARFNLSDEQLAAYDPYFAFEQTHIRAWEVLFYNKEKEKKSILTGYGVKLRADNGEVIRAFEVEETEYVFATPSAMAQEDERDRMGLYEDYKIKREFQIRYGDEALWPPEAWAELKERSSRPYLYALPGDGDMTMEEATGRLIEILTVLGVKEEALKDAYTSYVFLDNGDRRFWEMRVYIDTEILFTSDENYIIQLDAKEGIVLFVALPGRANG